jgi:hypothetical protein
MTFIAVQKHINPPKSIALTCSPLIAVALLFSCFFKRYR